MELNMKLDPKQIESLKKLAKTTLRSQVAEVLTIKAMSKAELANELKVSGKRPEHNIASQLTYLRDENYIIRQNDAGKYYIAADPDGNVPAAHEAEVKKFLGL